MTWQFAVARLARQECSGDREWWVPLALRYGAVSSSWRTSQCWFPVAPGWRGPACCLPVLGDGAGWLGECVPWAVVLNFPAVHLGEVGRWRSACFTAAGDYGAQWLLWIVEPRAGPGLGLSL